jgi:lipopolysaccharide exporter
MIKGPDESHPRLQTPFEEEKQLPPATYPWIRKSGAGFAHSVLVLGGGSAAAQILGVLAMPVIARLFLPEAFGTAALFVSFATILGYVAAFRYEFAIVLPKEDAGAANILVICFLGTILTTAATTVLVAIFGVRLLVFFNAPDLVPYRWLFPISIFTYGIAQGLRYWNTRNRYFRRQGIARFSEVAVRDSALIGGGLAGLTSGGHMIVARLIGELVSPLIFGVALLRHDLKFIVQNCGWYNIWRWAKRYRRFPLFDVWTALVQAFSVKIIVLVLIRYFGPREAGLVSQGLLLLWIPSTIIGSSVFQVVLQRMAEHRASGKEISEVADIIYRNLFSIGFFPLALVFLIGPDIFQSVLGRNWVESGVYARMLAPWIFFNFLYSPLSSVIYVLEKQQANLIFNVILLSGRLGALLGAVYFWGEVRPAVLSYGVVNLLIYLVVTIYLFKVSGVCLKGILLHGLKTILIAGPFLLLIALAKWGLGISSLGLLVAGTLFCLIYLVIIVLRNQQLRIVLQGLIRPLRGHQP